MKDEIKQTLNLSTLGQQMGIFIGLGFFLGHHGDIYYGTKPLLTWCGLILGIVLAAIVLIRATVQTKKRMNNRRS